jgi:hypothetical protein
MRVRVSEQLRCWTEPGVLRWRQRTQQSRTSRSRHPGRRLIMSEILLVSCLSLGGKHGTGLGLKGSFYAEPGRTVHVADMVIALEAKRAVMAIGASSIACHGRNDAAHEGTAVLSTPGARLVRNDAGGLHQRSLAVGTPVPLDGAIVAGLVPLQLHIPCRLCHSKSQFVMSLGLQVPQLGLRRNRGRGVTCGFV